MGKKSKRATAARAGVETRSEGPAFSVSDPAFLDWWSPGRTSLAGQTVNAKTALGVTGFWRAVNILTVIATLPLKTYINLEDGTRERSTSVLDNPHPSMTPFEWMELYVVHLAVWGNAYHLKGFNGALQLAALQPIHPSCVTVDLAYDEDGLPYKTYTVTVDTEQRVYTDSEVVHTPGFNTDGVRGVAPLTYFRNTIGTAQAGEEAAARHFGNGAMISGLVTSEDDVTPEEARILKDDLRRRVQGTGNAGDVAFVNRTLKFTPWSMSNEDAQFLESRSFQIDEFARMFGIPKVLLAQDGASTWGSGIAELIRGMHKFDLARWTTRIEQRLTRLTVAGKFCEFDYSAFMQPTPEVEIDLLLRQIDAGLITIDEARRIRNMPALPVAPAPETVEAP